jgi:hypothetical protein
MALLWPAIAIAAFAAILGPDRRWWPWILAPVALLLSLGPSMAVVVTPEGLTSWRRFGAIVPLACVGLAFSAWRPAASWLSRRFAARGEDDDDEEDEEEEDEGVPSDAIRIVIARLAGARRPHVAGVCRVVVLNAFATAVLVVSTIAFIGDPGPTQIGTPLPTFLGVRSAAQDARALMNLDLAMDAMHAHGDDHGTYRGFDAATAGRREPTLAWLDGPATGDVATLQVQILTASGRSARLLTIASSGRAFCAQTTGEGWTYGSADAGGYGPDVRAAIDVCGSTTWSDDAIRVPPYATMCADLDPQGGYLICRMVQALVRQTLTTPNPDV